MPYPFPGGLPFYQPLDPNVAAMIQALQFTATHNTKLYVVTGVQRRST